MANDRFELRRRLGQGGMGVVYEAFDRINRSTVALKAMRPLDPDALLTFKREFRSLADIEHDNLVRLGELFVEGDDWYFTMELVQGQDFVAWLRPEPGTPLDEPRVWDALRQLGSGLDALHAAGKVHRDVKPANVVVTEEGRVVILDFGLVADAGLSNDRQRGEGSARYMAPEQAASERLGPEVDWYGVGAMLYEVLTGQPPFTGPDAAVLIAKQADDPPPPLAVSPSAPRALSDLCVDLLRRQPAERMAGRRAMVRLGVADAEPGVRAMGSMNRQLFVGRSRELAELRLAWAAARGESAHAVAVMVRGESGIGKSSLIRRFLADLHAGMPEALVLSARCYERESVPFKAFDGVVDGLSRHLADLGAREAAAYLPDDGALVARLFPVLRRVPALADAPSVNMPSPQELRSRAFSAVRELMRRIAQRRRTVVFLDDVQWADADSMALIHHVLGGSHSPPLLLMMTARPTDGALAELLTGLALDSRQIDLVGLEPQEARALADELMAAPGEEISALVEESRGHPLFLHELVRHVATGGPRAVRLDDALRARVETLDPGARTLLEVIAVAGEPVTVPVARDAAGLGPAEGARQLAVLRAALLVRSSSRSEGGGFAGERVECYHDRVREAVTDGLAPDVARRHHRALAAALEAASAADWAPLSLVRHLEAAGDTERAGSLATVAARRAADVLAFDRSAELLRSALRVTGGDPAARRTVQMALGESLANAGRALEAASEFLAAAEGADSTARLECNRRAADLLLGIGHVEDGLRALASVLEELGERYPQTPQKALASLLWYRARVRVRGLRVRLRDPGEIVPRELIRLDAYRALAFGLALVDTVRGADFTARWMLRALQAGERDRLVRALVADGTSHASQGPSGRARALEQVALVKKLTAGAPALRAWPLTGDCVIAYFDGRIDDAIAVIPQVIELFRGETTGTSWEINTLRVFLALSLRLAGRYGPLRELCEEHAGEAARRGDRYSEATLRRLCCVAYLAADRLDDAEAELVRTRWSPPPATYHLQNWYEWRARAEIALYRGAAAGLQTPAEKTFEDLRRSYLWRVVSTRTEALWLGGRLALASAIETGDRSLVDRAARCAKTLAGERQRFATAWARLLEAGVAAARGKAALAAELLQQGAREARSGAMETLALAAELVVATLSTRLDGADRQARARSALAARGVVRPDRFAEMLVAGFTVKPPPA